MNALNTLINFLIEIKNVRFIDSYDYVTNYAEIPPFILNLSYCLLHYINLSSQIDYLPTFKEFLISYKLNICGKFIIKVSKVVIFLLIIIILKMPPKKK